MRLHAFYSSALLPLLLVAAAGPLTAQTNIAVPANGSVLLNQTAAYQNVTVGIGGSLETVDSNSGGGGDHAITITLAAYGAGTIQNDGTIELAGNDQGNTTVFANPVTLSGSGTLELLNTAGYNDAKVQGPGTVTQAAGHTLIGGGGRTGDTGPSFSAPLVNYGLVTTSNLGFVLDGASVVNNGTFSASNGAALSLAAPTLDNTNGTITVADINSLVIIENGSQVTGGTLQSAVAAPVGNASGVYRLQGGATLANLTIAANAGVNVADTGALAGTVINNGYLFVSGNLTLNLAGDVTLAGSGTLHLGGHLEGPNNATLTINPGQQLQLEGNVNASGGPDVIDANLINNGTLAGTYQAGTINSPILTNNGLIAASNGATLYLNGPTLNNTNGTISVADQSSHIYLDGVTVTGGTLSSVNDTGSDFDTGGFFNNSSPATLANVTLTTGSAFYVSNPITIVGTLTNNGYLFLGGYNFNTGLTAGFTVSADATLAGTGVARLAGGEIDATNNATLTVAAGASIDGGSGTINASLINNGTVESSYQAVTINSPTLTNHGLLAAANNASVRVSGSTNFTNFNSASHTLTGGTYAVTDTGNGATLDFGGRNVLVNAATVTLSGTNVNFGAINGLTTNAGTLSLLNLLQFTTSAALTNAGTINLDAGTTLHVGGDFSGGAASTLAVTLGGTQSTGAQSPGILQVNGAATAGGTLTLTFAAGATLPGNGDVLTVVSAGSPVQGSFGNVVSGSRLATADGKGSFRVGYGGEVNTVTLSDFLLPGQDDPTPTATLTALVPSVSASSGEEGEFQLTLSSAPSSDVVVNFAIKGTAVNGTDYVLLKATKKIKAGKTSKPIKIIPQGDLGGAAKKTVVLTLLPGSGYQLGTTGKVKVKITD